ncbi:MAG: hypothetical protein ABJC09_15775 [Terriglobia bacterium]
MITAAEATALTARLCCVARAICLLEWALNRREMRPGGVLNWSIAGLVDFSAHGLVKSRLEALTARLSHRAFLALLVLDGLVTTALFIFPANPILLGAAASLLLIQMKRHYLCYDGADEAVFFCLMALTVGKITGADRLTAWFIAAEACLAYLVAGIYKAASPFWKGGQALLLITRTRLFGREDVAKILRRHVRITAASEFAIVFWESVFPIALFVPPEVLIPILAVGLFFHLSCAWIMGLNTFLWAFGAMYPCVIFANQELRSALSPATRDYLSIGLLLTIGGAVALLTALVPRLRPLKNDYLGQVGELAPTAPATR